MKKITFTVLAVAIFCFLGAAANAATVNVSIVDFAFSPQNITVNVGDTVVWTNNGGFPHTTTSGTACPTGDGKWDSGTLSSGQTFSFTFTQAGTFPYFCSIHCFTGTVIVNAAPTPMIPAPAGQTSFVYVPVVNPVVNTNLSIAMPLAIGPLAEGGSLLNVQVGLAQYQVPVDIYIAFIASTDPDTVVNLAPDLSFQFIPFAQIEQALATGTPPAGMTPWMSNVQEPLNVTLFPNLPVTALAPGAYSAFLAATLHNSLANLDLFETDFILGVPMTDTLNGAQEVPANFSQGTGTANLAVDFNTGVVTGNVSFSGLTSNSIDAHIHEGAAGVNGPIIISLTGGGGATSGVWTVPPGTTMTPAQLTELRDSGLYLNIHSVNFPAGEIRTQLNFPNISLVSAMSGIKEVPTVATTAATGVARISGNINTGEVTGTLTFSGLSSPATAAHIHTGLPGVGGPIIVTLTGGAGGTSGTWTIPPGTFLTAADAAAGVYVNIHSVNFPTGEIRGDLFLPPGSPTP